MNVSLVMVKSDGSAKEFALKGLPTLVGRESNSKFRIPLAQVSRRHCELYEDDGELMIKDLTSANGTYVNGEKIRDTELSPGDLLSIGGVVFVVRIDGKPAKIDAKDCYMAGLVNMEETGDDMVLRDDDRPLTGGRTLSGLGAGKDSGLDDLLKDMDKDLDFGEDDAKKEAN